MKTVEQLQYENEILTAQLRQCLNHTAAMQQTNRKKADMHRQAASVWLSIRRAFSHLGIDPNP